MYKNFFQAYGIGSTVYIHCESKKHWATYFTAYNFRNIEQIFNKFGTNHVLFMLNIMP